MDTPEKISTFWKVVSRLPSIFALASSDVNRILGIMGTSVNEISESTLRRLAYLMNILEQVNLCRQAAESPCISDNPVRDMRIWLNMPQKDLAGKSPLRAMTTNPRHWLPVIYRRVMTGE